MDPRGKSIVITGAAQGLGQKIAEVVVHQDANLALVDLDHKKLQDTIRLCSKAGDKAKNYPVDVSDESAVGTLFNSIHRDFASVDGVINNAGVTGDAL
jgi:3-oxoacyl-[acyl-carrier protein] reductase